MYRIALDIGNLQEQGGKKPNGKLQKIYIKKWNVHNAIWRKKQGTTANALNQLQKQKQII